MPRINIISADSIMRRVRDCMVVGVAGMCIYMLPKGCETISKGLESRKKATEYREGQQKIVQYAEEGDFESAYNLLGRFHEKQILTEVDFIRVKVWLDANVKKANEKRVEERKSLESIAKTTVTSETLKSDSKASEFYVNEQIFSGFEELSPTNAAYRLERDFLAGGDIDQLLSEVLALEEYIRKRVPSDLARTDFSHLEDSWRDYTREKIGGITRINHAELKKGDRVVVVEKVRYGEDGKRVYDYSKTPNDIPLGTNGKYVRESLSDDRTLIEINGNKYWFSNYELRGTSYLKLLEINRRMSELEIYWRVKTKMINRITTAKSQEEK